jgi:hypothetical protein
MFNGASNFDQPLLYCSWQSQSDVFKSLNVDDICNGTITCGSWGWDTSCLSSPPSVAPATTTAPTPAPTSFPPAIERSWDMGFLTNATVENMPNSLDAKLSLSYNISNRAFGVKYFRNDCKSELVYSISGVNDVLSSDVGLETGFLKLDSTAILNSSEVFYDDRDDIYIPDVSGGGFISLCIRADLFLSDAKIFSVNFLEREVNISVDLETASFSIGDEIEIDRTDAADNPLIDLDYSNYVKAYQCEPSNVGNEDYVGTYAQGSVLNICVRSKNPQVIDIETITNMLVEQDVADDVTGGKKTFQYIADGEYNNEIVNIDCEETNASPKICIVELDLIGMFFEEANPPNLKVSGDASLVTADPRSGEEETTRLLRGIMELLTLDSFDTKERNSDDSTRALVLGDKKSDSDETGSFDIDVGGLVSSSKMYSSAGSSTTSKAGMAAFTTIMSSIVGGGTLLLLV